MVTLIINNAKKNECLLPKNLQKTEKQNDRQITFKILPLSKNIAE